MKVQYLKENYFTPYDKRKNGHSVEDVMSATSKKAKEIFLSDIRELCLNVATTIDPHAQYLANVGFLLPHILTSVHGYMIQNTSIPVNNIQLELSEDMTELTVIFPCSFAINCYDKGENVNGAISRPPLSSEKIFYSCYDDTHGAMTSRITENIALFQFPTSAMYRMLNAFCIEFENTAMYFIKKKNIPIKEVHTKLVISKSHPFVEISYLNNVATFFDENDIASVRRILYTNASGYVDIDYTLNDINELLENRIDPDVFKVLPTMNQFVLFYSDFNVKNISTSILKKLSSLYTFDLVALYSISTHLINFIHESPNKEALKEAESIYNKLFNAISGNTSYDKFVIEVCTVVSPVTREMANNLGAEDLITEIVTHAASKYYSVIPKQIVDHIKKYYAADILANMLSNNKTTTLAFSGKYDNGSATLLNVKYLI